VTSKVALNVVALDGMDHTFKIPKRSPKEVVIGVIRAGRLDLACKKALEIWKMLTES
jgi:hypothetical protein